MADEKQNFPDEYRHLTETEEILHEELNIIQADFDRVLENYDDTQKDRKDNYYDMDTRERLAFDRGLREIEAKLSLVAKQRDHLLKLADSPYFSRIDFTENGSPETLPLYIGRFNFRHEGEILIFDWRAPISSMFYDHDTGPAWYTAPDGRIEGVITLKRQFRIKGGKMDYVADTSETISDDVLQEELSKTSDERMKTIISTIQKEQNVVIRNEKAKVLVIQGAAGSGKTSIALHRIAFLLYRFSGKIRAEDIMILSPSKAFSDYISDVIPELGEEPVREYSFYELAVDALDDVIDFEDPSDPLDIDDEGWKERARFKSSAEFLHLLDEYRKVLPERAFRARDYHYDGSTVGADWIREQFLFYRNDPILERFPTITDEVIEEYQYSGNLRKGHEKRGAVLSKLKSMLAIRSPQALYRDFYKWLGRPELLNLQENRLEWPDVFPFLYLWQAYHGLPKYRNVKHLVVDEMQDYTPVQYAVLNLMYPCNKTILGDFWQGMDPNHPSTLQDLLALYPQAFFVELTKSYRSSAEIMEFAMKICPEVKLEVIDRHGKAPEVLHFEKEEDELRHICKKIADFRKSPHASLAILLKSGRKAKDYYEKLLSFMGTSAEKEEAVTLLTPESREFRTGVIVTSIRMAKGLEFDEVIIPGSSRDYDPSGFDRQLLYIACTRAMHELALV